MRAEPVYAKREREERGGEGEVARGVREGFRSVALEEVWRDLVPDLFQRPAIKFVRAGYSWGLVKRKGPTTAAGREAEGALPPALVSLWVFGFESLRVCLWMSWSRWTTWR